MNDFVWNENNVCLNPIEECVFDSSKLKVVVRFAVYQEKWIFGTRIMYSDGTGSSDPVSIGLNSYPSKIDARNAAIMNCVNSLKYSYRDYDNSKAIKTLNSLVNQLNLFESL